MPAAPSIDVRGAGSAWQVVKNGQPLPARYWDHNKAWIAADRILRDWRRGTRRNRNCLCCSHPFLSEGAHHRMCDTCRGRA